MKRIVLFVLLAFCLDRGLALVLSAAEQRTFSGDRSGAANTALRNDAGILVLGSSRAEMHVNPKVLEEKLGLTAYNAGLRGQDVLYSVMLFDLWKQRHPAPRAIVLTVDVESLIERPTEVATAHFLAPHMDESAVVREVMYSGSAFRRIQYLSHAYRFNGQVFSMLKHARGQFDANDDGFKTEASRLDPAIVAGVLNALDQDATQMEYASRPFSEQKLRYLQELAAWSNAHGTRLFLLHTPLYRQDHAAHALWMTNLRKFVAGLAGVEIIDLCTASHPEIFADKPAIYMNLNHLNATGADLLTGMLADEIGARLAKSATAAVQ
jgi:hypothetical protein